MTACPPACLGCFALNVYAAAFTLCKAAVLLGVLSYSLALNGITGKGFRFALQPLLVLCLALNGTACTCNEIQHFVDACCVSPFGRACLGCFALNWYAAAFTLCKAAALLGLLSYSLALNGITGKGFRFALQPLLVLCLALNGTACTCNEIQHFVDACCVSPFGRASARLTL